MAKRFSDSLKWDDPFFSDLSNHYKLLWIYILDKCDHAGIFKVNKKMADFCLNATIDWDDAEGVFKGRVQTLNQEKWFIPKFIEYQYGTLTEKNRVHNSIIQILKKEGVYKVCVRPLLGAKDMDMDKDMDKDKEKERQFESFWSQYPDRIGKKDAYRHFKATVKTDKDWENIQIALENYKNHLALPENHFKQTQNGKTWFNNWEEWVDRKEPERKETVEERDKRLLKEIEAK